MLRLPSVALVLVLVGGCNYDFTTKSAADEGTALATDTAPATAMSTGDPSDATATETTESAPTDSVDTGTPDSGTAATQTEDTAPSTTDTAGTGTGSSETTAGGTDTALSDTGSGDTVTTDTGSGDTGSDTSPVLEGGEVCATAIPVLTSGRFVADTRGLMDNYDAQIYWDCDGVVDTPGLDQAYRFELPAGSTLQVQLEAQGGYDPVAYLVSDCLDLENTCVDGSDLSGPRELIAAATGAPRTLFLIVDSYVDGAGGAYALDVLIAETAALVHADTCATATPLAGAGTYHGNTLGQTPDYLAYDPAVDPYPMCDGPDQVWSLDLLRNQTLDVTLRPFAFDGSVYLTADCATAPIPRLVLSERFSVGESEQVSYTAAEDMQIFIVVDGFWDEDAGPYDLDVAIY